MQAKSPPAPDAEEMRDIAMRFRQSLLDQFIRSDAFFIAIGTDRIHVYVQGPANRWPIGVPKQRQRVKIDWHWDVGEITAAQVAVPQRT
jgi:hypothetical protein